VNVSLTPELERLVTAKVASGMYASASEVIRAGLRLLEQWEADQGARLDALRRDVAIGVEQADRGDLWDGPEVFDQLRKRRAARAKPVTSPAKTTRKRKKAS
jgi:antitoxin ParD1/3/4